MLNKTKLELKNQIGQEKLIEKLDVSKLYYNFNVLSQRPLYCTMLRTCLLMIVPLEDMTYHLT